MADMMGIMCQSSLRSSLFVEGPSHGVASSTLVMSISDTCGEGEPLEPGPFSRRICGSPMLSNVSLELFSQLITSYGTVHDRTWDLSSYRYPSRWRGGQAYLNMSRLD